MSEIPVPGRLAIDIAEQCDRGKVRAENQDSVRHMSIALGELLIVADGIGGYEGGATASRMVVEGMVPRYPRSRGQRQLQRV
jgi:serine/threonine protein phosphatase PrpC